MLANKPGLIGNWLAKQISIHLKMSYMDVIFHFLCNLECLEDDFFQNVKKTDQIHQRFFLQKFRAAKYFGPTFDRLNDQLAVQSGRQNCKQIDVKMKYRFTRSAKPDAVLERLDKLVNPSLRSCTKVWIWPQTRFATFSIVGSRKTCQDVKGWETLPVSAHCIDEW